MLKFELIAKNFDYSTLRVKLLAALLNVDLNFIDQASIKDITFLVPSVNTKKGLVSGANNICRLLCRARPLAEFYGTSLDETSVIDSELSIIECYFDRHFWCSTDKLSDNVINDIIKHLEYYDGLFGNQTYIVCNKISIADIAFWEVTNYIKCEIPAIKLEGYVNIVRHYNGISQRANLSLAIEPDFKLAKSIHREWDSSAIKSRILCSEKICPSIYRHSYNFEKGLTENKKCTKQKVCTKDEKSTKQDQSKSSAVDIEEKAKAATLANKTSFDMETWKRNYSNFKDMRGQTMPYLWEKAADNSVSFYHMKYERYDATENTSNFMASNLLGMFLQRIDGSVRRISFAVCNVLKADGYYDIEGIFMFAYPGIPPMLEINDQFDSFIWTRLDKVENRAYIEDFLCECDELNGRKIEGCKLLK